MLINLVPRVCHYITREQAYSGNEIVCLFPNVTVAQCMPVVGYQIQFLEENCCHGGNFASKKK
jgi:hypothetical protein